MFEIILFFLFLEQMWAWVKAQLFLLFYLLFILYQFFMFFHKRTKKISYLLFLCLLFHFLMMVFLFLREKSYKKSNINLFCNYSIIFSLFKQFGLVIEHNKSEIFHFSRSMKNYKCLLWISVYQKDFFCIQKKIGDTYTLFSTENSLYINTFTYIPTRPCFLSKA